MLSLLCSLHVNNQLATLDCNPLARTVATILDVSPTCLLQALFEDVSLAEVRRLISDCSAQTEPKNTQCLLIARPLPILGVDAHPISVNLKTSVVGAVTLEFEIGEMARSVKSFWMISAYYSALLRVHSLVCNASGTVVASNIPERQNNLEQNASALSNFLDTVSCERIYERLGDRSDQNVLWRFPNVLFSPLPDTVYAGDLTAFPLRVDGAVSKLLISFRAHDRPQTELVGNNISITSFIAAIEHAQEGIAILDPEARFLYVNRSHCNMFGYASPGELIGQSWRLLYDQAEVIFFEQIAFPALAREEHWQGAVQARKQDGSFFAQHVVLSQIQDVGLICTCRDITAEKRMTDALRTSEARFRAVVQHAKDAIITLDDSGEILHWNQSAENMLGYSEDIMLGQNITRLLPAATGASGVAWRRALNPSNEKPQLIHSFESELVRSDGESVPVDTTLSDWYCAERKYYRTLIARDISERLRSARQLLDASDKLNRAEIQRETYSELVGYASSIIAKNSEQIVQVMQQFANTAALSICALFRVADSDLALEPIATTNSAQSKVAWPETIPISKAELSEILLFRRVLQTHSRAGTETPLKILEKLRRVPERSIIFDTLSIAGQEHRYLVWCEFNDAEISEKAVLMLELTALKLSAMLEAGARISAEARRTALQNVGQVAASLAHEANNLTGIIGNNVELLLHEKLSPAAQALIGDIRIALDHHHAMVNSLLNATRMDNYNSEHINPEDVIKRVSKLLSSSLPDTIALNVHSTPSSCLLAVDGPMFSSALLNLLINAYHACGARGTISVNTLPHGKWLDITVCDDGCGIAPQVLRRVTDPFYSTKKNGRGTGLGLFMVKNFCAQSAGELLIESAVGKGTTVTLRLPITSEVPSLALQNPIHF